MPRKLTPAPAGSKAAGRRLWRAILEKYELEEHELELLRQACRTADLCAELQVVIDRDGPMVANRFREMVPHPAVIELRQQRVVLARLIAALRVPDDSAGAGARPQRRGGARGVYRLRSVGS